MRIDQTPRSELEKMRDELRLKYSLFQKRNLKLDLTRGKPAPAQLDLSNPMDGDLDGNYFLDSIDLRNYGGIEGLPSARKLGAELLGLAPDEIIAGGNSSLTMMYQAMLYAYLLGPDGQNAWCKEQNIKFLCPSPGYDRHFAICEQLNIKMISVELNDQGPDMDQVENIISKDPSVKGMWCVPKYSNPTGCIYSPQTVDRIAALGKHTAGNFRVFWDNAYAVHDFHSSAPPLANIMSACRKYGTENTVLQFTSTSKITHAGSGVAFMGASKKNLSTFCEQLGICTIGPDKVNQARLMHFLPDIVSINQHMAKHAAILKPKFDCVLKHLEESFKNSDMGQWTEPTGGYFISFNTRHGLATTVVKLAADAGVKLTSAGATYPYGKDPKDSNIRLAPSFPSLEDIDLCMEVFTTCVKLASVEEALVN